MIAENAPSRYPVLVSYSVRLKALQSLLRKQKLPVLLVTNPVNIRYLTGLDVSRGLLLVRHNAAALFLDSRYLEAGRTAHSRMCTVHDWSAVASYIRGARRCGFEELQVTAGQLRRWESTYKNTKFIHTSGLVEGLRRKKDREEIACMKRALSLTNRVLRQIPRMLRRGMTEKMLERKIFLAVLDAGGDGFAFDPIVAFGSHSSMPHHRPGKRKLRARDIVQIDMGVRYKGYCSDRSEVYFVGKPTAKQQRVYEAVRQAKDIAKKMVREGAPCADIDTATRTFLHDRGISTVYDHALGHGVGLEIHEGATVSHRSDEMLMQNEVVTVEPGVYIEGAFGIRLEDMVFVQ